MHCEQGLLLACCIFSGLDVKAALLIVTRKGCLKNIGDFCSS